MEKTHVELIAAVNGRLREEWGISIASIDESRLRDEIMFCESEGNEFVTTKIPSRSEFMMSLDEANAVRKELRTWKWRK
jgi:hypothetical protein